VVGSVTEQVVEGNYPVTLLLLAQDIFEPNLFPYKYSKFSNLVILHTYPPMKMEQTECSETSAYKIQTPGNYLEENIQQTNVPAFRTKYVVCRPFRAYLRIT
jgi:hypothetical protein